MDSKKILVEDMVKIKDEGNTYFGKGDYGRAITYYK